MNHENTPCDAVKEQMEVNIEAPVAPVALCGMDGCYEYGTVELETRHDVSWPSGRYVGTLKRPLRMCERHFERLVQDRELS